MNEYIWKNGSFSLRSRDHVADEEKSSTSKEEKTEIDQRDG